jgi:hypothetical protein
MRLRPPLAAGHERFLALAFLLSLLLVTPYIRGDGNGYYAYVRSIWIDRDLDFRNEYERADPKFREALQNWAKTPTGLTVNPWAPGSAVLWTPFFLAGHAVAVAARASGAAVAADGFSPPYRWAVAIGSACYGFLALLLCYRLARAYVAPRIALAAVLALWVASSVPVYMYFLPMMAQVNAMFTVTLLVYFWHRTRHGRRPGQWFVLGLLAGFSAAVKTETIVFVAVPALALVRVRQQGDPAGRVDAKTVALVVAGLGVGLLPHMVIKTLLYGRPWDTGYEYVLPAFLRPRPLEMLFSSLHGMFSWTPILLLATLGFLLFARKDPELALVLGVPCVALYYLASGWQSLGVAASSFGNRPFVSATVFFTLGLAALIERVTARVRLRVLAVALAGFGLWNVLFIVQFGLGLIPRGDYFQWSRMVANQFRVPLIAVRYGELFFRDRDAFIAAIQQRAERQRRAGELQ